MKPTSEKNTQTVFYCTWWIHKRTPSTRSGPNETCQHQVQDQTKPCVFGVVHYVCECVHVWVNCCIWALKKRLHPMGLAPALSFAGWGDVHARGPVFSQKCIRPNPHSCNTIQCYAMLCYAVPHYNILYCTTLYYTVPYYTTLYHAIPHYTYCLVRLHCTLQYLTLHTEYTSVKYTWAQGWRFPGASKNLVFRCKEVGGGLGRA